MIPSKDTGYQTGYKSKTHLYAVYRRLILDLRTPTAQKWKVGEPFTIQIGPQKKAGVAILIPDQLKFISKTVVRDEEGHYIILKGSIQQEDLKIMNIYSLNVGADKYIN